MSEKNEEKIEEKISNVDLEKENEDNKKANILCCISLLCNFIPYLIQSLSNTNPNIYKIFQSIFIISGFIFMIIARIIYPKNKFGKVLMWLYIIGFILFIIFFIIYNVAILLFWGTVANSVVN